MFTTIDTPLATYLCAHGYPLVAVALSHKKVEFQFDKDEDLDRLVHDYYHGDNNVNAMEYEA
ncbi:MAG: DUF5659 domain-containing protein, partial [Anaerolineae bacterium]